jgi:hypothetical protein
LSKSTAVWTSYEENLTEFVSHKAFYPNEKALERTSIHIKIRKAKVSVSSCMEKEVKIKEREYRLATQHS